MIYTADQLKKMKTIYSGHFGDLKVDTINIRLWSSRMTVADGANSDYGIDVERIVNGRWETVAEGVREWEM